MIEQSRLKQQEPKMYYVIEIRIKYKPEMSKQDEPYYMLVFINIFVLFNIVIKNYFKLYYNLQDIFKISMKTKEILICYQLISMTL